MTSVENSRMLDCWLSLIKPMLDADQYYSYELRILRLPLHSPETKPIDLWKRSLTERIRYMHSTLLSVQSCELVLFTDPDVLPVSQYSLLVPKIGSLDALFQPKGFSPFGVNPGFVLLRNTQRARGFLLKWWQHMQENRGGCSPMPSCGWNDQKVLNEEVLGSNHIDGEHISRPHSVRFTNYTTGFQWNFSWSTWMGRIVAAKPDDCSSLHCVAFHAVLHGSGDSINMKLAQISQTFELRRRRGLPSSLLQNLSSCQVRGGAQG